MDESSQEKPQEERAEGEQRVRPFPGGAAASELEKRAVQMGTLAGQAAALLRDVRKRLREPDQPREDGVSELGPSARAQAETRVDELRRQATAYAEKWRRIALEKTDELRQRARAGFAQAHEAGREYPLQFVLAAGAVGFALGVTLRRWRAKRAVR